MKILVPLKRVADPANHNKVKIPASGDKVDTAGLEWQINPFDRYALEEAVRTKERMTAAGDASTVTVLSMGPPQAEDPH